MAVIEVHAGDFKAGKGHRFSNNIIMMNRGPFNWEKIKLDQVQSVEPASEESVKRMGGTIGWGLAGAAILGPVGLLAGLLGGGRGKDVTFVCELKDGRRFLATAPSKVFTKISASLF